MTRLAGLARRLWATRPDPAARLAVTLLRPAGWLYGRAMTFRAWRWARRIKVERLAGVPVISVGNLTQGGTGKTPLVLALALALARRGLRPAVVLRGYGGRAGSGPLLVQPDADPAMVGDEAAALAAQAGLTVVVGSDRLSGARLAAELGAGVVLLDDGFQHLGLARDLDLVLLDAAEPLGNGRVFPAGPLREPAVALRRASALILTRAEDPEAAARSRASLARLAPGRPVWTARHVLTGVENPAGQAVEMRGRRILLAAGVARPDQVARSLAALGPAQVQVAPLADHQAYDAAVIDSLNRLAEEGRAEVVVATAKDWPKLRPSLGRLNRPAALARLEMAVDDWAGLERLVLEAAAGRGQVAGLIGRAREPLPETGEIIVRLPNWVGDAVMAAPCLANLRAARPGCRITLLAHAWTAGLFQADPRVDRLLLYRPQEEHAGLAGRRRLAAELAGRFQVGLLLPNSLDSALVFRLGGLGRRVGYARDGRGLFLTDPVPCPPLLRAGHQVDYYLGLLTYLGLPTPERRPRLYLNPQANLWAEEFLLRHGLDPARPLLGLAPGAAFGPAKQWPAERFAQAGRKLADEAGGAVLVFGAAQEKDLGRAVAQAVSRDGGPPALDLTGATRLDQAAALIARMSLMVVNDSGLMHLAAALGAPLVALFGPTDPARNGPRSTQAAVLRAKPECAPCFGRTCRKGRTCLEDIQVEEVVAQGLRLLAQRCPAGAGVL